MAEKKVSSSGGDGGAAAAVDRAASLLEAKDHEAAASLADEVLDNANRSVLAQAALIRGKALLQPLVDQIKNSESEAGYPAKEAFRPAWQDVMLALSLEPDNAEAKASLDNVVATINMQSSSGEVDEERQKRAMADPEIQAILGDAQMRSILSEMQTDPKKAQAAMNDPSIAEKLQKLIAAGVLQVR